MSRLIEAIHVMRTFLAEGAITFKGDFFKYDGLYTFARPVQEQIPIKMGAMKGRGRSGWPARSPTASIRPSRTPARPTTTWPRRPGGRAEGGP